MSDRDNTHNEENFSNTTNQDSLTEFEQEKLNKLDELIEDIVWQQSLMLKLAKNDQVWL